MAELFGALEQSASCNVHHSARTQRLTERLLHFCLMLGLCFAALWPRVAHADQSSDTAVDIFVQAGAIAGLPIDPTMVPVIKGLVNCATSGSSGVDCAKNIVVSTVLDQLGASDPKLTAIVKPAATCLVNGGSISSCVGQAVISQLPKETQTLATCVIGGGNVADCTKNAALAQILPQVQGALPAEAKDTVNCVIGGTSLATCAKNLVTKEVNDALRAAGTPPDVMATVTTMVNCVSNGGNAADCAKSVVEKTVADKLPPEVKGLASCLSSTATAQTCMADYAASKISDATASAAVKCMGLSGKDAQACMTSLGEKALGGAAQQAQQQAVQTALAAIQQLNVSADAVDPRGFPQTPAVLQNFVLVAQGIKDGDWSKVLLGGGAQIAQIASRVILSIFLTPAVANLVGPVADMMIQNGVTGFQQTWAAARNGDPVGVAQAVFTWYETTYIVPTCGLMPNGAFKNTVCGAANDAINWVAGTAGGVAKDILGVGKDILQALGLWNTVDDLATGVWKDVTSVVNDIGSFLGLGGGDNRPKVIKICTTQPKDYFANNVMNSCLADATSGTIAGGAANTSGVTAACVGYYSQCSSDKATVQNNCQKMSDALGTAAQSASITIKSAAAAFTTSGAPLFAGQIVNENIRDGVDPGPRDLCSPTFWSDMQQSYATYCASKIAKFFPASFQSSFNSCPIPTSGSATRQACLSALNASTDKNAWAGPTSAFCQKQKQADAIAAAMNPCKITGTTQVSGSGKVFNLPEVTCTPLFRPLPTGVTNGGLTTRIPFRPDRDRGIDLVVLKIPNLPISVSTLPWRPGVRLPASRIPPIAVRLPGEDRIKMPSVPRLPSGGGGFNTSRQPDSDSRLPGRVIARPTVNPVAPGPGSGGFNTSRGGNSAMDNLGGINSRAGLAGVAGNSGGAAIGRPPMMPAPSPVVAGSPKPPSGGSGGAYMVNGASGNSPTKGGGSGGAYMVNGASGNSPTKSGGSGGAYMVNGASGNSPTTRPSPIAPRPSTTSTRPSVPDSNFNYGACPGCGKPQKDPLVVR